MYKYLVAVSVYEKGYTYSRTYTTRFFVRTVEPIYDQRSIMMTEDQIKRNLENVDALGIINIVEIKDDENDPLMPGKWLRDESGVGWICPNCKNKSIKASKYCPECGFIMEEIK